MEELTQTNRLIDRPFTGIIRYGFYSDEDRADWENEHRTRYLLPEHRLMQAVLEDARHTLAKHPIGSVLFQETADWIMSDDNPEYIFSFVYICQTLGIDPSWARKNIGMRAAA